MPISSKEPAAGRRPPAVVPGRSELAQRAVLDSVVGASIAGFCVVLGAVGLGIPWAAAPGLLLTAGVAWSRHRSRVQEVERTSAREAEVSIYRVAERLQRADREEELVRQALDAIGEAMGIERWAFFGHPEGRGAFSLLASRGFDEAAADELAPDPVAPDAASPASRAAWHRERQTIQEDDPPVTWTFQGARESRVVSMPLPDGEESAGVLQCIVPAARKLSSEQRALLRWMASQLSSGLKRLRLERRDQLLASYLLSSGEILLGTDRNGTITHANAAAERALGVTPGALVGEPLDEWACPDVVDDRVSLFERARSAGSFEGDVWIRRSDGSRFPLEARVSPASDRRGTLTGMVLVGRDATDRRGLETERQRRSEELSRVNEELQRLNRELQESQRLQNDFLANTSHELRTPLNAVIGFATLLESGTDRSSDERREFARSIRDAAQHLLAVINDLLDLSKAAAGRFRLQLAWGDLRPAIEGACAAVMPLARSKGLRLEMDLPADPLEAAVDPARLRQVLLNVLGNAVKFTDNGTVRVRAWHDAQSQETRIRVEDTGIGIGSEVMPRLFTKFAQADPSYHRRHRGTGLGLAISRVLAENMGGTIRVASDGPGRGTRVDLAFPAPLGAADLMEKP
ncbi:MAG TPA: ATP-binding protein [Candidatus Eisenbacteria bacterium]|nr:ATP-binding protein [Candidatus Eisenbacteria bacterium]